MIDPTNRREYLGSHALCTILHPDSAYKRPAELYAYIVDGYESKVTAELQRKWDDSHIFEGVILERYAAKIGKPIITRFFDLPEIALAQLQSSCHVFAGQDGQIHVRHKRFEFMGGTLDGLILNDNDTIYAVVDAKCVWNWRQADSWHHPSQTMPLHIRTQGAWLCMLTGIASYHIVAKMMCNDGVEHDYVHTPEPDDLEHVYKAAYWWWNDHVVANHEPDPESCAKYSSIISDRWRGRELATMNEAGSEMIELAIQSGRAKAAVKAAQAAELEITNRLKAMHQGYEVSPVGTYKANKKGDRTFRLAKEYQQGDDDE